MEELQCSRLDPSLRNRLITSIIVRYRKIGDRQNGGRRECEGANGRAADAYSLRSATIGSTVAARNAGIQDATSAAAQSNKLAIVSIRGSHGATP
jgi:hypothetical protein